MKKAIGISNMMIARSTMMSKNCCFLIGILKNVNMKIYIKLTYSLTLVKYTFLWKIFQYLKILVAFWISKDMADLLLSIDVEEWFQVENLRPAIDRSQWNKLETRAEKSTEHILNILEEYDQKATFFILGWIAEKFPDLIKEISLKGHEIASHGFEHEPVYNLSKEQFKKDLIKSKEILEKHSNQEIIGFRAPTFSMTRWGLDILKDLNFVYDSSYQPHRAREDFYISNSPDQIKSIVMMRNGLYEIPLSENRLFSLSVPWSGGGYFRLIPYPIFRYGIRKILKREKCYCFYIHPWEFDSEQPKVKVSFMKKFKHYHKLSNTEKKFRFLLKDFAFKTIRSSLTC